MLQKNTDHSCWFLKKFKKHLKNKSKFSNRSLKAKKLFIGANIVESKKQDKFKVLFQI